MPQNHFKQNFETQTQTSIIDDLPVQGNIPDWLFGTLMRNGPGQFEVAHAVYPHWFDGLCMMHRFTFINGKVSFANQFLQSQAYIKDNKTGTIHYGGVATPPPPLWRRIIELFNPQFTDNCNINYSEQAAEYLGLTELPASYVVDPYSLATLEPFQYDDTIDVTMETAHPHYSRTMGGIINYMIKFSLFSTYDIYHVTGRDRTKLVSIPVAAPAYMHSFGFTERYVVLTENPMRLPPILGVLDVAFQVNPFIFNFKWYDDKPTRFTVIDLNTNEIVARVETDGFYVFHHINSYQDGNEIVHDLAAYPTNEVWSALYLDVLRSDNFEQTPSYIRRFRIPIDGSKTTIGSEQIGTVNFELPRINYYQYNALPYRYAYGVGVNDLRPDFTNQLAKVDVSNGDTKIWFVLNNYPGEPIFVAKPGGTSEDDGVVLSTVYDADADTSFLLVLDGITFDEIARCVLPYRLPFGFHGMFYPGLTAPIQWAPPPLLHAKRRARRA
jgi:carotenoid cleavage dioxygenase-like enzyme